MQRKYVKSEMISVNPVIKCCLGLSFSDQHMTRLCVNLEDLLNAYKQ